MALPFVWEDYFKPHFKEDLNEVGFRIGVPVIAHEIKKQPAQSIKDTKYNKEKVHSFKFHSIDSSGIKVDASYRWESFEKNFFTGKLFGTGQINANLRANLDFDVSRNGSIVAKQPVVSKVQVSTSGKFKAADLPFHALSYVATGGKKSFGFFEAIGGIGAVAFNLKGALDPVSLTISDPIKKSITTETLPTYMKSLLKLDDSYGEIALKDIRYDSKGASFIFSYPEKLESLVENVVKPVAESYLTSNSKLSFDNPGVESKDGIWFGIFGKDEARNGYSTRGSLKQFKSAIKTRWDGNFRLSDVEFGGGTWFGTFKEGTERQSYSTRNNLKEFKEEISQRWKQGYDLAEIEYGDGIWFGVFQQDSGSNGYEIRDTLTDFKKAISEKWEKGYSLVDTEYGDGSWFGVFQKGPNGNAYSHANSLDGFKDKLKDRWDKGYHLVDVEYGEGIYFGTFQKSSGANAYSHKGSLDPFKEAIKERWGQGYDLTEVSFLPRVN